ncbi:hypothetical protein BHE74_00051671 [Ensete ventricosum]|nr:hypothetical protein BHE74_00051671 [Ensete ventricosum]
MHNVREWLVDRTVEAFGSSDITSVAWGSLLGEIILGRLLHNQCWGFGVVAEESGRPGPCRVYKLVQVSQGRGLPIQIGSASREFAPLVGSFGLRLARAREKMPPTSVTGRGLYSHKVEGQSYAWPYLRQHPGEVTVYDESVDAEV